MTNHNTLKIRVFIVDDHYLVIEGLRSLLAGEADIECCGHAMNGASCLAFLQKNKPDLILLDINLPDSSGIELCQEITQKHPEIGILGLSSHDQYSFIKKMMESGAKGYVLKNVGETELKQAIRAVAIGNTWVSAEAARVLRSPQNQQPIITRREKEVLELIAQGLTNGEIAEKLFVSVTTVDSHRKNLLLKLGANNTASLISQAYFHGLIEVGKA